MHRAATPSLRLADFIDEATLHATIEAARDEDLGVHGRDITSEAFISADTVAAASLVAREAGIASGLALLAPIAAAYGDDVELTLLADDGDTIRPGDTLAILRGQLRQILAIERVALNFVGFLSGIATITSRYVAAANAQPGARAAVCDTRKTLPGMRRLSKYAVVCGGGVSHRMGLHDAVLVKDNHIAHVPPSSLGDHLRGKIRAIRSGESAPRFIEVEVDTLAQMKALLDSSGQGVEGQFPDAELPDIILLDNMRLDDLRTAVALRDRRAPNLQLEASGGVTLDTIGGIAATGVDRISIGALTHSARWLDVGLDIAPAPN